jgi:hypothetical protein
LEKQEQLKKQYAATGNQAKTKAKDKKETTANGIIKLG